MHTHRFWSLPCLLLAFSACEDEDNTALGGGTGGQMAMAGQGGAAQGGAAQGGSSQGVDAGMAGGAGMGVDAGSLPATVGLELVATGLTSPVALQPGSSGTGGLFIADQIGTVRSLDASGQLQEQPFLDIRDRVIELSENYDERGLLGLAFHPDYAQNGRLFVHYSAPLRAEAPGGYDHTSRVSEFQLLGDGSGADPASERILLQIDQPQSNHNGGSIAFGPDGYLYIPIGDGGAADDVGLGHVPDWYETNEGGNGQDLEQNLLGSILRIDVNAGDPYAVPEDNPFVGSPMPEVWAYGFRNPYRMAFDSGGEQQLFAGDVGQNLWEEVDVVIPGGNYGWNVKEGTRCFSTATPNETLATCPSEDPEGEPLLDPILEYPHPGQGEGIAGLSVIGGNVYRGSAIPELAGRYVFGDWSRSFQAPDGRLFVASPSAAAGGTWSLAPLQIAGREAGNLGEYLLSFGQDAAGELYVLTTETAGPTGNTGKVYRLVP